MHKTLCTVCFIVIPDDSVNAAKAVVRGSLFITTITGKKCSVNPFEVAFVVSSYQVGHHDYSILIYN